MRARKPLETPMFDRIALIGIGLIGSSICHASKRANLAREIVGTARTPATVETALRLGLISEAFIVFIVLSFDPEAGHLLPGSDYHGFGCAHLGHSGERCGFRSRDHR
jgi:hypothetical protein